MKNEFAQELTLMIISGSIVALIVIIGIGQMVISTIKRRSKLK